MKAKFFFYSLITLMMITPLVSAAWTDTAKTIGKYIIGDLPDKLLQYGTTQAWVVLVAIWVMIFLTFGDIIANFSTFSKWVSWVIAFAIAVVAANIKLIGVIAASIVGAFSTFGAISVAIGLGAAFVAFLVVNLGITYFAPWIMGRKAMMQAQKSKVETEAGGVELQGTVKALKGVGKAIREKD